MRCWWQRRQTTPQVAYLLASPEFGLINGAPAPSVEPFGLLDGLPTAVLDAAREWERHVVEVETGLTPGSEPGAASRPGYEPGTTTLMQRDEAKAMELEVSVRTVQLRRARYARQGLSLTQRTRGQTRRGRRPSLSNFRVVLSMAAM
jgi:hypothetical protein